MNVRTYYYNTAPRGVPTRDRKVVEDEISRKVVEDDISYRGEDEPLPQKLRLEIAGRVLDALM